MKRLMPFLLLLALGAAGCSDDPENPPSPTPDAGGKTCGNGVLDRGEKCDPGLILVDGSCPTSCDDGDSCTADTLLGLAEECTAECSSLRISQCLANDGCCAQGCNSLIDTDCTARCGNGIVETGEKCDSNCPASCDDGNACTADVMNGTVGACTAECTHTTISTCVGGDGCCAAGCNANTDTDCSASCGNGTIESGETCDGTCPANCVDGNACTTDLKTGSVSTCNVACTFNPITSCASGDGCCPASCNALLDTDCNPRCGNLVVEGTELCDGNCPSSCSDSNACTTDSLSGSAQTCDAACVFTPITQCRHADGCCAPGCNALSDSDCSPICPNGVVEPNETCDGNCPSSCNDNNACTADTSTGAAQTCNLVCTNTQITSCANGDGCCPASCNANNDSDCRPVCGNGVTEGSEKCDGANCPTSCSDASACTTDALVGSADNCTAVCTNTEITACTGGDGCCPARCNSLTDSNCQPSCGNAVVEAGEKCDGNCPVSCDDNDACTTDGQTGATNTCDLVCTHTQKTVCANNDGCCPSGCNNANDNDCSASCGNGIVEGTEKCDKNCPTSCSDGVACTSDVLSGSADQCNVVCTHIGITGCAMVKDDCCPAGCNSLNDADCTAYCGNGVVDGDEKCDGATCPTVCDDGKACTTDVLTGSNCSRECVFTAISVCSSVGDGCCPGNCNATNDADCQPFCGNGVVEGDETCEGASCPTSCNDGNACTTDTLVGSANQCTAACTTSSITACANNDGCCPNGCTSLNDNNCTVACGNNTVEPGELCDGNCPTACNDNIACTTDTLTGTDCTRACTFTPKTACSQTSDSCCPTGCNTFNDVDCQPSCGNKVVEAGEKCDGNCPASCSDGKACTTDTLIGSALACTAECTTSPISACSMTSDGCCPAGCTNATDADCTASGLVGDACDSGGNCASGLCIDEAGFGWKGGYCTASCTAATAAADCGATGHCANIDADGNGLCMKNCSNNTNCRTPDYECFDFDGDGSVSECAVVASGTGAIGSPCDAIYDCAGGQVGYCADAENGWSDGYCTASCDATHACPTGSHCGLKDANGQGMCLKNCGADTECRNGDAYLCADVEATPDGAKECVPGATGPGAVGAPCNTLQDCGGGVGGFCHDEAENDWADGYCMISCSATAACPAGSHCGFKDAAGKGVCLQNCSVNTECRGGVGYACVDAESTPDGVKECFRSATGTGTVGAACTGYENCAGGINGQCYGDDWSLPGGYCSTSCGPTKTCATGSHCMKLFDTNNDNTVDSGFCVKNCSNDSACRTGYACYDNEWDGVKECFTNGTTPVGGACTYWWDCVDPHFAYCIGENNGQVGGYCAIDCTVGSGTASCPSGSFCSAALNNPDTTATEKFCMDVCASAAECRSTEGYTCQQFSDTKACWHP